DANGASTWYVYDANNRLTFTLNAIGEVSENVYDDEDRVIATRRYSTTTSVGNFTGTVGTVVTVGNVVKATRNGATVTFKAEVGTAATLTSNSADNLKQIFYDRDGRVIYTLDAAGTVTELQYDNASNKVARERVFANKLPVPVTTYTLASLQLALTAAHDTSAIAAGDVVTYKIYDERARLAFTINGVGDVVQYQYENAGDVIATTAFINRRSATQPMTLSALQSWVGSADPLRPSVAGATIGNNPSNATTRAYYDALGRVLMTTDATGVHTFYLYEFRNRKVGEIDGTGRLTEYIYNGGDDPQSDSNQVIKTITYATPVLARLLDPSSQFLFDSKGNPFNVSVMQLKSSSMIVSGPDDQVAHYVYNDAGQLIYAIDPAGNVTETRYDAAGRVNLLIRHAVPVTNIPAAIGTGPNGTVDYGELRISSTPNQIYNPLTGATYTIQNDSSDRAVRYFYDNDGRLTGTINMDAYAFSSVLGGINHVGFVTENKYNTIGELTQTVSYAAETNYDVDWGTGTFDKLRPVTTPQDQITQYFYDAEDRQIGKLDAEGYL
ncbi:MAG TPA: hypothetical protein VET48_05640, partial [Steroidobacteraceae bacterium]|nr:hypothetical protein [Steroidobacteraceae bacterium]